MSASKNSGSGTLGAILGFFGLSSLAGLLVAALVAPAVAVTGMAANTGVAIFDSIPSSLTIDALSEPSTIVAYTKNGEEREIAQFYDQNRRTISIDEMSENVTNAAIAAEDRRFYEHSGVDVQALGRAIVNFATGGELEGASTITMQYVRNVAVLEAELYGSDEDYLAATEVTAERKLIEIRRAIGVEQQRTKEQILEGYLNSIIFGGQVYGIEAAAQRYYSVSAAELTISQAASLIAIVQRPEAFRLDRPDSETNGAANGYAANKVRRDDIVKIMFEEGMITEAERDEALATAIEPKLSSMASGCQYAKVAPFFCDYVQRVIKTDVSFGDTSAKRFETLTRGGLRIYTTLDIGLQNSTQKQVEQWAPRNFDQFNLGGVAISIEVGTGHILTMALNKKYDATEAAAGKRGSTSVNYATDANYGGSSGFQSGSTWKTFTLATWLKAGKGLDAIVSGSQRAFEASEFPDRCLGAGGGSYAPKNGGSSPAAVSVVNATVASINTAFLDMATQLDLCDIRETAESLGMHRADGRPINAGAASTLGSDEIAPMSMAAAYAAIANGGVYCPPTAIERVEKPDGTELQLPEVECTRALDENIADTVISVLKQVLTRGTGTASNPGNGMPVFGKTGTSEGTTHTWIVTSTPKVATAVWVGNVVGLNNLSRFSDDGLPLNTARHRIMKPILQKIQDLYGNGSDWGGPDPALVTGAKVDVPNMVGMDLKSAQELLDSLGLGYKAGGFVPSDQPRNQIVSSNPAGGSSVVAGTPITLYKSSGTGIIVPDVVGLSQADAETAWYDSGWSGTFSYSNVYSDTVPVGYVVSTNRTAGQWLEPDAGVRLRISQGPEPIEPPAP